MRTRPAVVAASLVLAALLTGCAVASDPVASPEPTTSASETPQPAAAPRPSLTASCDDLFPAEIRASLLGGAGEFGTPPGPPDAMLLAERQVGATVCAWSLTAADGSGSSLDVTVLTDARTDFEQVRAEPSYDTGVTTGEFGDDSTLWCGRSTCSFEILTGDAWISGSVFSPSITWDDAGRALVAPVLEQLTAAVADSPRNPDAWVAPDDAASGWGWDCWSDAGPAAILTALDESYGVQFGSMGSQIDIRYEAPRVTDVLSFCNAAADDYAVTASAAFLEGGAWAAEDPDALAALTAPTVVQVPGATHTAISCAARCTAYLAIDGSLLIVDGAAEDVAVFEARLPELVAAATP